MKTKRIFKFFALMICVLFVFLASSCGGCGGAKYATKFDEESANSDLEVSNKIDWMAYKLDSALELQKTANEELKTKYEKIDSEKNLIASYEEQITEEEKKDPKDDQKIADLNNKINVSNETINTLNNEINTTLFEVSKTLAIEIIDEYIIPEGISGESDRTKAEKNYKVVLIRHDETVYADYIKNAKICDKSKMYNYSNILEKEKTSCTSCFFSQTNVEAKNRIKALEEGKVDNIYDILAIFTLQVTERTKEAEPLHFYADSFGDFMGHFFNNIFVFPVGWLLQFLSFGNLYIIGLLLTTLIIRTIGWPIYAKTNDMSIKMKAIEPEVAKIQAKYANRQDPDSQRRMQMEQAQLYKQHGIGIGGCLLPFLQFPIFMAVYRAVSRIPYTVKTGDTIYQLDWATELNSNVFGLNLFEDYTFGTSQLIWVIILVILVAGSQFLSQVLSELRQKKAKEKAQEDVPMYRRQAMKQQANEAQNSMKIMMYLMIFMMAVFVWTSKAGLGVYWLIGNLYSMLQTYINSKTSEKKLEKIRQQQKRY